MSRTWENGESGTVDFQAQKVSRACRIPLFIWLLCYFCRSSVSFWVRLDRERLFNARGSLHPSPLRSKESYDPHTSWHTWPFVRSLCVSSNKLEGDVNGQNPSKQRRGFRLDWGEWCVYFSFGRRSATTRWGSESNLDAVWWSRKVKMKGRKKYWMDWAVVPSSFVSHSSPAPDSVFQPFLLDHLFIHLKPNSEPTIFQISFPIEKTPSSPSPPQPPIFNCSIIFEIKSNQIWIF